ncbi:MAG: acyltransferase family protein [Fluviicola sp.]
MKNLKVGEKNRVFGLDVYRAVAIILVVLSHGSMLSGPIFSWLPHVPLPDGVELFFVLSGFLIGTILIKTLEESERFGWRELVHFWKRRWFRTLPNYYLILLVNFILVSTSVIGGEDSLDQFNWKFLFFAHNLYEGFYGFFWESWSLSVEEWFYISLPLIIIGLRFFLSKRATLLASIVILIAAPLLYRYSLADENYDAFWFDVEVRKVVIVRLDTIIYGVLAAYIAYYYKEIWYKTRWITFLLGLFLMYQVMYTPHPIDTLYGKVFYFTALSIAAMLLLPMAASLKSNPLGTVGRGITFISKISYAMYLVNLALVAQVIINIAKDMPPLTVKQHWLAYIIFWTATIIFSTVIYYLYEKPMTKLRDIL